MSAPTPDPALQGRAPWGVSVAQVAALVPDVAILPAADPQRPVGTSSMTVDTVRDFIDQVSTMVLSRIGQWQRVIDEPRQGMLVRMAAAATCVGTASYVEAAAHARADNSTYQQVLWDRYLAAVEGAAATLDGWLLAGGDDIAPQPGTASGRAASSFPQPTFPDAYPSGFSAQYEIDPYSLHPGGDGYWPGSPW